MFEFQAQCQPHLTETVKSSVEGICLKVYHLSADYAKKIKDKHWEILKEQGISGKWSCSQIISHFSIRMHQAL